MKVPQKIHDMARKYLTHGDIAKIVDINADLSRYDIQKVLNNDDEASPEAIAAVAKYYTAKEEILSDYIID